MESLILKMRTSVAVSNEENPSPKPPGPANKSITGIGIAREC
jgi:hypothetical protein